MADRPPSHPSLIATIARRIILFAVIAMAVQLVIVLANYYLDDAELGTLIVEGETAALAEGIERRGDRWIFNPTAATEAYRPDSVTRFARIRSADGETIFSNCADRCLLHLLPKGVDPPGRWSRLLSGGKPISVAGGQSVTIDGQTLFIEVAVVDADQSAMWRALGHEFADHLAIPMMLQLVLVLGGALVSVAVALRPVRIAAEQAERIDPLDPGRHIDVAAMPSEIAELGSAVNRALERIGGLMREQKLFTTAIAHEIRTPLAMLLLELGQIDHPRARRMERDVEELAQLVGQITALGRLEAIGRQGFAPIEPASLARSVVASVGPLVYDRAHSISVADEGGEPILGDRALLEDALINLVGNAVAHTPAGTSILVCAGPGRRLAVVDDAGLYRRAGSARTGDRLGIGLAIVRRIAALHGATLDIRVEPGQRTSAVLSFADGELPNRGEPAATRSP